MITPQDKGHKRQLGVDSIATGRISVIAVLALMALTFGAVGLTKVAFHDQAAVESSAPLALGVAEDPVLATTNEAIYLYARHYDNQNYVLTIDPQTGIVNKSFSVGYNAIVKLTTDKRVLYAFNAGKISALDTQTGTVLWMAHLPGFPFTGRPTNGAWLSADEKLLYLQASFDGFQPRIFVVDTQTQTLVHDTEIPLPYPSNVDQAFPIVWKLPWAETLVVISRDLLFTFDPASGKADNTIPLFAPESIERVPKDLPQTTYIHDGVLDPGTRQLFLATSTQEILSVNLDARSSTVSSVISLPAGAFY